METVSMISDKCVTGTKIVRGVARDKAEQFNDTYTVVAARDGKITHMINIVANETTGSFYYAVEEIMRIAGLENTERLADEIEHKYDSGKPIQYGGYDFTIRFSDTIYI